MDFIISNDKNFIQFGDTIVDSRNGLTYNMDTIHPAIVCEIFKTQFTHAYKTNLMETNDLFRKMKELIYPLINHNKDIVSEYEVRYGMNMILETNNGYSYGTHNLIENSWEFVKNKIMEEYPVLVEDILGSIQKGTEWVGSKVKQGAEWVGNKLKDAGKWILNKGLPWFFKKLEDFLLSPVGIGLDIALTTIGIGKIATTVIWGALGVWKIYQLFSGQIPNDIWSYIDIGICLVGLVFTGGAAKGLQAAVKAVGRDVTKLSKGVLKPLIQLLGKGLNTIMNVVLGPIQWLSRTFGGGKINEIINVAKNRLKDVFAKLEKTLKPGAGSTTKKVVGKGIKQDLINPTKAALKDPKLIGKGIKKGVVGGLAMHGAMKGIEHGAKAYYGIQQDDNVKKTKEVIKQIASDDKQVQQALNYDLTNALDQMKQLENQ